MNEKPYTSIEFMMDSYTNQLEKASNIIGIDRNAERFINPTLDIFVINSEIRRMYAAGQEIIYGYRRFKILNNGSAGLSRADLQTYVNGLTTVKIHRYVRDTDVSAGTYYADATAKDLLMDLNFAYNYGLKTGLSSNNSTQKELPEDIFSTNILQIPTKKGK